MKSSNLSGTPTSVRFVQQRFFGDKPHIVLLRCRGAERGVLLSTSKTALSRCSSSLKRTVLCGAHRSAAKQPKREVKTCRLSLAVAAFHCLPAITMVHQAGFFGPGPSPLLDLHGCLHVSSPHSSRAPKCVSRPPPRPLSSTLPP